MAKIYGQAISAMTSCIQVDAATAISSYEIEPVPHRKVNKKLLKKVVAIVARRPRARRIILED